MFELAILIGIYFVGGWSAVGWFALGWFSVIFIQVMAQRKQERKRCTR